MIVEISIMVIDNIILCYYLYFNWRSTMNINNLSDAEKYLLTRYLYKYGMSPINDIEYDELEKTVKSESARVSEITDLFGNDIRENPFETSYDDDTTRPSLLIDRCLSDDEKQKLMIMEMQATAGNTAESLEAYVSKSMLSYRTLEECKPWIDKFYDAEFCISPKIDGINTTTEYVGGKFCTSRTRGRGKNAIDISYKMGVHMPSEIDYEDRFIVVAEAVVAKSGLEDYNKKIGLDDGVDSYHPGEKALVTCRGAALSILRRTDIPEDCINYVNTLVFRTNIGDTLAYGLEVAKSLGFNTVPFEVHKFSYKNYEEYTKEISELIWKYKDTMENLGIPTDGLVLQINDNKYFGSMSTNTAYDGGNLAVKALAWEAGVYTARVKDIIMSADGNYQYNCKAKIEPTYTAEGKKMQLVNLYNVNTMITNDVHPGDYIQFEYVNETTINFKKKVGVK